ncbi:lycopene beta cyclase [Synechococcus sp. M16CYN]|uniref:lycopene beta cyclase n=1 Tax=Synechococcus sp. M16CYN TaxID=3103139 RepID=UPI003244C02E
MVDCIDVLVIGGGPAALCIASELIQRGVAVQGMASNPVDVPWTNTYGIWVNELESLGLESLLEHRWKNTVSFFGAGGSNTEDQPTNHGIDYGLFSCAKLQRYWLSRSAGMTWHQDSADRIDVDSDYSIVVGISGKRHQARMVIDASGHCTPHINRPNQKPIAKQAAYGVVGRFSKPPVKSGQFVLMDFRCDHLTAEQRNKTPTFLYAMDFGKGLFFLEETSLASAPAVSETVLKQRLKQRLAKSGVAIIEVIEEEHCLFPMNLPLPDFKQPVLAFGGAASMVHPASGYMVGSLLRRGPGLADVLAAALKQQPSLKSAVLVRQGWQALWPTELVLRHRLFQFGLNRLMDFDETMLRRHFTSFFQLPQKDWNGFLTNTLSLPQLMKVMLHLFIISPWDVRRGLVLGGKPSH